MSFIVFLHNLLALEGTSFSEDIFTLGFKTDERKRTVVYSTCNNTFTDMSHFLVSFYVRA